MGDTSCCLPCPVTDWIYYDDYSNWTTAAELLAALGLVLMIFMLLSIHVLPARETRTSFLTVCITVSGVLLNIGCVIPLLGTKPDLCFNEITPNAMMTSTSCAWSGAFIHSGALCIAMWLFIRSLYMYLYICQDITPSKRFFVMSQVVGWGVPAAFFIAFMIATGYSFRFSNACFTNREHSLADFWGPLLTCAGGAAVLQTAILIYCLRTYLESFFYDRWVVWTAKPSQLPSHTENGLRSHNARAVWVRLKKVLALQWRSMTIVMILLVDMIHFSVLFLKLDSRLGAGVTTGMEEMQPWLLCVIANPTNKAACTQHMIRWIGISHTTLNSVLIMIHLAGLEIFILLCPLGIFPAWWRLWEHNMGGGERISMSVGTKRDSERSTGEQTLFTQHRQTLFEMQKCPTDHGAGKPTIEAISLSPSELPGPSFDTASPLDRRPSLTSSTFQKPHMAQDLIEVSTTQLPTPVSPLPPVPQYGSLDLVALAFPIRSPGGHQLRGSRQSSLSSSLHSDTLNGQPAHQQESSPPSSSHGFGYERTSLRRHDPDTDRRSP